MLTWDENKRRKNLKDHGIDFAELDFIFDLPLQSDEDRSSNHSELRMRSLGIFQGKVVVVIWVHLDDDVRVISCRYGEKHETREYFKSLFHSGRN